SGTVLERLALVPGDELKHLLVLEAIEVEVVHAHIAVEAVLVGEKDLDRNVPDELLRIQDRLNRAAEVRTAVANDGDQFCDLLRPWIEFVCFRLERAGYIQ